MTTQPKKQGRLAGRPQQPAPAKVRIAEGEPIALSANDKKILGRVRRFLSDALDCTDEIDNNVQRGERRFFAANTALLKRCICGCRRLCRGVSAIAAQAKRRDAR